MVFDIIFSKKPDSKIRPIYSAHIITDERVIYDEILRLVKTHHIAAASLNTPKEGETWIIGLYNVNENLKISFVNHLINKFNIYKVPQTDAEEYRISFIDMMRLQ